MNTPTRTQVMGILNITEDSFSDGGQYLNLDAALAHAHQMIADGADLIDIGGESTRPGAVRVSEDVELARVIPIVRALHADGIAISVDTMRASVAEAAVQAGAAIINDVSGGLADPNMYAVMADTAATVCLMHWKANTFGDAAGAAHKEGDVVREVREHLLRLCEDAQAAGVRDENITIDPGLGFAKTHDDNWQLLHALPEFVATGYPVLVGASRKRFLTQIRAERGLSHSPIEADPATAAISTLAAHQGAWCVRVHDVASSRDAVDVAAAWGR